MHGDKSYHCPHCKQEFRQKIEDLKEVVCVSCNKRFKVRLYPDTGNAAFIETGTTKAPEPLFMPKGSIRALVTILMAVSCWVLIFTQKEVPNYLFGLILTLLGYYFGFRKQARAAASKIFDASEKTEEPLFLPHGFIRFFIIAGFLVCGITLHQRGGLKQLQFLEFFVILSSLVGGYIFSKIISSFQGGPLYILINHLKGALVIFAALGLMYSLVSGDYLHHTSKCLTLTAIISFYFGSRS